MGKKSRRKAGGVDKAPKRKYVISDDDLFKDPPPKEDCPLCFLPMPGSRNGVGCLDCCGKSICRGCIVPMGEAIERGDVKFCCPFCKEPFRPIPDDEAVRRCKRRSDAGDAVSTYYLGMAYSRGDWGLPEDHDKALELWRRAAALGSAEAHMKLADCSYDSSGPLHELEYKNQEEKEKTEYHVNAAAMLGCEQARHCRGYAESFVDPKRAMRHYMISASAGYADSLEEVTKGFRCGHLTKQDYEKTLRAYHRSMDGMKSDERGKVGMEGVYRQHNLWHNEMRWVERPCDSETCDLDLLCELLEVAADVASSTGDSVGAADLKSWGFRGRR